MHLSNSDSAPWLRRARNERMQQAAEHVEHGVVSANEGTASNDRRSPQAPAYRYENSSSRVHAAAGAALKEALINAVPPNSDGVAFEQDCQTSISRSGQA